MAKRPDVLVIESGEIELPTKVQGMKTIGLPPNVIYACLAETIVLALEGRFEVFTVGRDTEWEKVKEIYKLGLKHGMKLAAISGVKGVYSDEDIARVVRAGEEGAPDLEGRQRRPRRPRQPNPRPPPNRQRPARRPPRRPSLRRNPPRRPRRHRRRQPPGKPHRQKAAVKAPARKTAAKKPA